MKTIEQLIIEAEDALIFLLNHPNDEIDYDILIETVLNWMDDIAETTKYSSEF